MNEINFKCLVRFAEPGLYIAQCMDYSLIARGSSEKKATEAMLEVFVGTYLGYKSKGRDMMSEHPRQEPFDVQKVELWDDSCESDGVKFTMTVFTTPDSIRSSLRSKGGLWSVVKLLPGDYDGYGGEVVRDTPERFGADCTTCKWFHPLSDMENGGCWDLDWGVCTNPESHRAGLLTWEHQGCLMSEYDEDEE